MPARIKLFIPLLLFVLLATLLFYALQIDTKYKPSALLGSPMPEFKLSTLANPDVLVDQTAIAPEVSLLNVWASWCVSCRVEHPWLTRISEEYGIPIYGVNYKDTHEDATKWLQQFGNPYRKSFADQNGRLGMDLGLAGAPETFVLDAQRVIRYKHVG
ncbi:MAG: DsbE family thiol:disulfide interchange protein, partial [Pseudomonadales bacterium]